MSRVGKILWGTIPGQNPRPYLCITENCFNGLFAYDLVDLEYGDYLTLFDIDIKPLLFTNNVFWDDDKEG